jgi:hypothetical protein
MGDVLPSDIAKFRAMTDDQLAQVLVACARFASDGRYARQTLSYLANRTRRNQNVEARALKAITALIAAVNDEMKRREEERK